MMMDNLPTNLFWIFELLNVGNISMNESRLTSNATLALRPKASRLYQVPKFMSTIVNTVLQVALTFVSIEFTIPHNL